MRQERPVLRVTYQGSFIDVTPGQPWYVGIGAACNVRLPIRGPAEAWFVVRHAGVWTVRAVDLATHMWLDGIAVASDRSVRIGTSPSQELRARRGAAEVVLTVTVQPPAPASAPTPAVAAPPAPAPAPVAAEPSAPVVAEQPAPVAAEPPPAPSPDSGRVLRQAEPPAAAEVMREASSGPIRLSARPLGDPSPYVPSAGVPSAGVPSSGVPSITAPVPAAPAPPSTPDPIRSVDQFLAVMKHHKWLGFMAVPGPAGRAVVLRRRITAGSRAAEITPNVNGEPIGDAAGRTIYELICPAGQRFPAGYLRDEGLVLSTNGRTYAWSVDLFRDISVIDALPPPLGKSLGRELAPRDVPDDELITLLDAAARRLLGQP